MSKPEDAPAELIQVIVRRAHSEEEGHHGGVWKIAYADFMTAMMAFFLVMWLVNAANTEMKSSVASYFNPIKLSDTVIRKKGLMDVDGKANAVESSKARNATQGAGDTTSEATPLQPGEAVKLGTSKHAERAPEATDQPLGRDGNADESGRASDAGRAFRDPFNPFAPGQLMTREGRDEDTTKGTKSGKPMADSDAAGRIAADKAKGGQEQAARAVDAGKQDVAMARGKSDAGQEGRAAEQRAPEAGKGPASDAGKAPAAGRGVVAGRDGETVPPAEGAGETQGAAPSAASGTGSEPLPPGAGRFAQETRPSTAGGEASAGERTLAGAGSAGAGDAAEKLKAGMAARLEATQKLEASAAGILRDIQKAVNPVAGDGGPAIEVTIEGNGVVLSLTDTSTFGMFAIGSSEPSKQTLDLIARIAPIVAANSKLIVVRGHTDSRVYRTQSNNNWRLSVSRAEAAYAMLVRAGIDEARFTRIEGHADRKLKVPADSEAAGNRRIEILLQQVPE